jgi:hypothetical protein
MTQHDAAADLAYIRQVMAQTRRYTATKGIFFVLWGSIVSLALIGTWFQWHRLVGGSNFEMWIGAMTVGWLVTLWLARREEQQGSAPHNARLIGMNWTAVGSAMGIFYFVGVPMHTIGFEAIPGLSALLVGIGIFNTGHLAGLRWLAGVGVLWLVVGGVLLAFPGPYTLWAMVALLVLGEVVPGLVLMRQERQLRAAERARG